MTSPYGIPDLTADTSWMAAANCAGVDPDLFFPKRGEDSAAAKAVCRGCTVRQDCLDYALRQRELFGIWGGTSERERRHIRSRQRVQRARVLEEPA